MDINLNINLLCKLEGISGAAASCGLDFTKLDDKKAELLEISEFLGITHEQTVFFSCISELSFQKTVSIDALSKHMGCSSLKLVTMLQDVEALEKKGYVQKVIKARARKYSYNDFGYNVPHNVIEALRMNDRSLLDQATKFDLPGFLKHISDMVEERQSKSLLTEQLMREVEFLTSSNLNMPFIQFVDSTLSSPAGKCTIFCVAYSRLKGAFCLSLERFSNALFDDLVDQLEYCQEIAAGTHELIRKGMLKSGDSEFDGDKTISLEHRAAKVLYQDYPALLLPDPAAKGATSWRSFKRKKLYYPAELMEEVKELQDVLQPGRFRNYRKALLKSKLSSGVTAIFFGAPGTGKTETVYQIARNTGRDVCMVDLSQTKSKWFGESEKRVKQIFVDYSEMLKNTDREPILFINEADGLFSRRTGVNGASQSSDQTLNTMQNILLQSLEGFEGILIATTNLTGNLDRAFERRFTFKMDFPKPDVGVRMSIWKSKVPKLSEAEAARLAEKFDLTGGEIDIQVRQVILKRVLNPKVRIVEALEDSCKKNHGFSEKKRIGF